MKYLLLSLSLLYISCATQRLPDTIVKGKSYKTAKVKLSEGKEVAYIDVGDGDHTLLFIHGLGSAKEHWLENVDQLQQRYRCIAIDLPGYGASAHGDWSYDMTFFSETVAELIDRLRLRSVTLVGHSMGGHIVLRGLVDGTLDFPAVLVAPAGIETFTPQEAGWMKMVYTPTVVESATDEQIRQNLKANFHEMSSSAEFMIEERIAMKVSPDFKAYTEMIPQCVAGMLDEPVYDQLGQIDQLVLILFGAEDGLIPNPLLHKDLTTETIAVQANAAIPGSALEIIEGCGHMMQWECAAQVNKAINDFLKK